MALFTNILVALDIEEDRIADTGQAAAAQAYAVARAMQARITFVHVLDVAADIRQEMLESPDSLPGRHYALVQGLLNGTATAVTGIQTQTRILFGMHWRALMLEVQRGKYDLVVIGTKRRGIAGRMLFGSTGNKLLRVCPCPLWVVKARASADAPRLLVAHDLSSVGEAALRIGAALAALNRGELHVLHVLEHPESRQFLSSVTADARAERMRAALAAIDAQCHALALDRPPIVRVVDGSADEAILEHVRAEGIDLLLMGTVARIGLAALLTGNTAEHVLPWIDCSLLALKPADFVAPLAP
jgi:nucleotide-binding universal stress UspA family protein